MHLTDNQQAIYSGSTSALEQINHYIRQLQFFSEQISKHPSVTNTKKI